MLVFRQEGAQWQIVHSGISIPYPAAQDGEVYPLAKLREKNQALEALVAERTREAEDAQLSRTRFLAAISHDVLQPLNAARLFASALRETTDADERTHLAERVGRTDDANRHYRAAAELSRR